MKLDLHLGAHRTGTTAFQFACRNNASTLAQQGVEVWGPDVMRAGAIERFPNSFQGGHLDDPKPAAQSAISTLHDAINERRDGGLERLVVSEENLIGSMRLNLETHALYPKVAARLAAYKLLFPLEPDRIFFCLRSYGSYWASSYAFAALRNDLPIFGELEDALVENKRGWIEVLQDIRDVFPSSQIIVWEHKKTADALRGLLTAMFGPDAKQLEMPGNLRNRALGATALFEALALRAKDPTLNPKQLQDAVEETNKAGVPPFQPFLRENLIELNGRFSDDVAKLSNGDFPGVTFFDRLPANAGL